MDQTHTSPLLPIRRPAAFTNLFARYMRVAGAESISRNSPGVAWNMSGPAYPLTTKGPVFIYIDIYIYQVFIIFLLTCFTIKFLQVRKRWME